MNRIGRSWSKYKKLLYVKRWLSNNDRQHVSGQYEDHRSKIEFIGTCGHKKILSWKSIQETRRFQCNSCAKKKMAQIHPSCQIISQKEMENKFRLRNCRLISQYRGMKHKTRYVAACGHRHTILPSAFHQGQGTRCPRCMGRISNIAISWLEHIIKSQGIQIQHGHNATEFRIPGTNLFVDGYCSATNTVYEFYGDYWHGNPNVYDSSKQNTANNKTFGELYQKTLSREKIIKSKGFDVITMWQSEWIKANNDRTA